MTTIGGPKIVDVERYVTFEASYFLYLVEENPALINLEEGGLAFARASRMATAWSIAAERRRHATDQTTCDVPNEGHVPADEEDDELELEPAAWGDYLARHTRRVSSMTALLAQAAAAP